MKTGFDSNLYASLQREQILSRVEAAKGRLYMEFGGKLLDDYHAARVLPGFDPAGKIKLLQTLSTQTEILLCINSSDIEKNKQRSDIGITYELDVLRLMEFLRSMGLYVSAVVITQYDGQAAADTFRKKLEQSGERVFIHRFTKGYPTDIETIVSEEGYGANPYIPVTRPLVVVTAPGPGSGKLATCLSQMYHEFQQGHESGYAKFETFPVWSLPLNHPVNLAYEAATADLDDVNMIDPFHLEAYGTTAVNYNRDVEVFPILRTILQRITQSDDIYKSPTDMGVNVIGKCVIDDEALQYAARQEILRRYFSTRQSYKLGRIDVSAVNKIEMILSRLNLKLEDRAVVAPALQKSKDTGGPAVAIQLPDGSIVTGRTTEVMSAPAAALINAIKKLSGIRERIHLISPSILNPIIKLKSQTFHLRNPILNLEEVLVALSISAVTNPLVEHAMESLASLRGCEAHASYMLPSGDEKTLMKLEVNLTCEPMYPSKNLYYEW